MRLVLTVPQPAERPSCLSQLPVASAPAHVQQQPLQPRSWARTAPTTGSVKTAAALATFMARPAGSQCGQMQLKLLQDQDALMSMQHIQEGYTALLQVLQGRASNRRRLKQRHTVMLQRQPALCQHVPQTHQQQCAAQLSLQQA